MALNLGTASTALHPTLLISPKISRHKIGLKLHHSPSPSCLKSAAALSEGTESTLSEEEDSPTHSGSSSTSARIQMDLLDQLTSSGASSQGYESDGGPTIREQLANLVGDSDDDFTIPLGKNLKKVTAKFLTTSQKRNIRRQTYLNEVSRRNDSVFFATIGAFVILPPIVILGIAIATDAGQFL
ncbi:uncharacterized protein LOC121785879 isoform X3 [Salvia splendens]|uniref:uncharacterized protein LOC121785879 isoform X3 n=1 Tax=Salvia splendens TaxID=180675 RepID=UPI001C267564|nr:uncharacterized protein LOC121785879 isoform X3 [Salvia splendens]